MLDGTIHSTTGMLVYDDTAAAHDYIVRVFGLTPGQPQADPAERDVYREVRAGDQVIGLHPAAGGFRSPAALGAVTGMTVISVDDADAHYARSVQAGAEIVEEPITSPTEFASTAPATPKASSGTFTPRSADGRGPPRPSAPARPRAARRSSAPGQGEGGRVPGAPREQAEHGGRPRTRP